MNHPNKSPQITLRIPGPWNQPRELIERLDNTIELGPQAMRLPDGSIFQLNMVPPDTEFPKIFPGACRQPLTPDEQAVMKNYRVNVLLTGEGGSLDAARVAMKAANAFVKAGAAGVFCDNNLLAHGASSWNQLTEDSSPDALSFAFIGIVGRDHEIETVGFHTLGRPEIRMRRQTNDPALDERVVIEIIRFLCRTEPSFQPGDFIADFDGLKFHIQDVLRPQSFQEGPMHNPFGCLQLVSKREIAESN